MKALTATKSPVTKLAQDAQHDPLLGPAAGLSRYTWSRSSGGTWLLFDPEGRTTGAITEERGCWELLRHGHYSGQYVTCEEAMIAAERAAFERRKQTILQLTQD